MSFSILICCLSGFFWAVFDLTRKLSLKYVDSKILLLLFTFVQIIIFLIWCLKDTFYVNILSYFIPGIVLIILGIFSALLFLKSIKESDLSLTIPLLSFSPLFSSVFSFIFLDEELSKTQYLGVFSIIFGTLSLYSNAFNIIQIFKGFIHIKRNQSAKLMLLVALCWSVTPVLDKMCLKHSSINIHGLIQAFATFIILLLISVKHLFVLRELKAKHSYLIFCTVIIGSFATITQFYAILLNFVPIMESIKRAIGQFSAILFGSLFFDEKISLQKITGIIFISIGVIIII